MAVISKGLELWISDSLGSEVAYKTFDAASKGIVKTNTIADYDSSDYFLAIGLQEIGELNGLGTGVEREKIEVTTLKDDRHVYVDGIIADSDTDGIEMKFLYDVELFNSFKALAAIAADDDNEGYVTHFLLSADRADEVRSETSTSSLITNEVGAEGFEAFATWEGKVSGVKLDSVAVNSALTMTVTITPTGEIELV